MGNGMKITWASASARSRCSGVIDGGGGVRGARSMRACGARDHISSWKSP